MEAGLLQSKQDIAQEGANIQSRLQDDNKEYQEDLESRTQTEAHEAEALKDKFKILDAKLNDLSSGKPTGATRSARAGPCGTTWSGCPRVG